MQLNLREGDPYQNLGAAIVYQAALDYKLAKETGNEGAAYEIKQFFHSLWFGVLTTIDPDYLIRRLEEDTK